ncbi:unnamed protein product [Brassica oleracea var. botrytis]|uniref:(rape) hypothetical protein n=1 Tax=Brassica napus TaxID=3708 RepID=A0A816IYI0_BRANA|nr:unnamed protein product [Brassica napus]
MICKLYVLIFASLVHKFHPVSAIINDSLRITKEAAEKAFRDAENEPASQQSQTAEPPSVAEVGSVTSSNIRLEHSRTAVSSSASKPGSTIKKKNRGQKRSQSSVHVASDTSNHFPEHGCSLNKRLSWPVDHCSRGFNSDYNHNQWTQPEGPPQYHLFLSTI